MGKHTEPYVDEFYESIRAPQFFDLCAKSPKDSQLDSWFATKEYNKYDDSSEEEIEEISFSGGILPNEEFDSKTPPKMGSRSRISQMTKQPSNLKQQTKTAVKPKPKPIAPSRQTKKLEETKKDIKKLKLQKTKTVPHTKSTLKTQRPSIKSTQPRQSVLATKKQEKESTNDFIFRALPLDRRVLESCGDMGVPKIAKLPTTRPVSPKLSTARRSAARRGSRSGSVSSGDESNRSSGEDDRNVFSAFDRQKNGAVASKPFRLHTAHRASVRNSVISSKTPKVVDKASVTSQDRRASRQTSTAKKRMQPGSKLQVSTGSSSVRRPMKQTLATGPISFENNENNNCAKLSMKKQPQTSRKPLSRAK